MDKEAYALLNREKWAAKLLANSVVRGDCVLWTGGTVHGSPLVTLGSMQLLARRVAWVLECGPLNGAKLYSTCGNRACIAIRHLVPGKPPT